MSKKKKISLKKPNLFIEGYNCAELDNCFDCFWNNGEQCIREILSEGDIEEMEMEHKRLKENGD